MTDEVASKITPQPSRAHATDSPRGEASGSVKQQKPARKKKKKSSDRPRSVEAPRSRVKDSTEQKSLMKPYYLYDDDK